jgi:hypothetical protein
MLFYAGGTRIDDNAPGYSFFMNFFSDLGRLQAYSGEGNILSVILFIISVLGLGIGFLYYFLAISQFFNETEEEQKLSKIVEYSGKIAAIAFIGVAVCPANIVPLLHDIFVVIGFSFVAIISGIMFILILRSEKMPKGYALIYIVLFVLLLVYGGLFFVIPEILTMEHLIARVTIQKIVVYTLLLSLLVQSYGIWKNIN